MTYRYIIQNPGGTQYMAILKHKLMKLLVESPYQLKVKSDHRPNLFSFIKVVCPYWIKQSLAAILLGSFYSIASQAIPIEGHKILISGPSQYAVEVGRSVARAGGNVIDVAVATELALAVTVPYFAAFGGGGFAMIKMSDHPIEVLDFREVAPLATSPDFYKNRPPKSSLFGGAAIGVPGVVAGLVAMHNKYGSKPWSSLFQGALTLAEEGFHVTAKWVKMTQFGAKHFNGAGNKYFLKPNGTSKTERTTYLPGELFRQPQMARLLRLLQTKKGKGFYAGPVARDLVKSVAATGGVLSLEDLANYRVKWRKPIVTQYKNNKLYLMPPPSAGGVVISSALYLVEKMKMHKNLPMSAKEADLIGQILKASFEVRGSLADPEFSKINLGQLLAPKRFEKLHQQTRKDLKNRVPAKMGGQLKSGNTTHFSIMDKNGDAIALTVTLNIPFGSGVVSDIYGVALNDEMDDFTTRPGQPNVWELVQNKANFVEPGKRPLSSMSPTLVTDKAGKVILSVGAMGGPKIISSVFQILYRVLESNFNMDVAIQTPRVHHQFFPDQLFYDKNRWSSDTLDLLRIKGHELREKSHIAIAYGVRLNDKGFLEGAFDSRGEGAVAGF